MAKKKPAKINNSEVEEDLSRLSTVDDLIIIKNIRGSSDHICVKQAYILTKGFRAASFRTDADTLGKLISEAGLENSQAMQEAICRGLLVSYVQLVLRGYW